MSFERTGHDGTFHAGPGHDFTTRRKSHSRFGDDIFVKAPGIKPPPSILEHYLRATGVIKPAPQPMYKPSPLVQRGGHQPKDMRDSLTRARDTMRDRFKPSNNSTSLNRSSNYEVYDQMGTVFGLGASVHGGTELVLNSSKTAIIATKHMGPEAAFALKSTAKYVGKVASFTSRGATFLSGGYSVYELVTNQAKAHTWVNLSVIVLTVGAEFAIGVAAAPYIIVGGVAYGVFCIAGGGDWLDSISFKKWFN
ncbi:MAG: hypothetical protein E6Q83_19070 [Thiothrix sp.]|nr:MAG: hypothetical protein E6Q83_19070 [Thiothrix sp.]